jgi:hypothetical protein
MRKPFLKRLLDALGAALSAAAFAEENEASTARRMVPGRTAGRRRRGSPRAA